MDYEKLLAGVLELFIETLKQRYPKQGTDSFRLGRSGADVRVGASEAHKLVRPTLSGGRELVIRKLGCAPELHGLALLWGNTFESVHSELLQMQLRMRFYNSPGNLKGPPGVSASPDGLGLLWHKGRLVCALYELKCPFSRIPTPPTIKPEYRTQVYWGLEVLNHLVPAERAVFSVGLFSEAVFRCCELGQLDASADHNLDIHREPMGEAPEWVGMMLFYCDDPRLDDLFEPGALIDFGQGRNLSQLIGLSRFSYRFEPCSFLSKKDLAKPSNSSARVQDRLYALAHKKRARGLLCWKLFGLYPQVVEAAPRFVEAHMDRVAAFVAAVNELRGREDQLSKLRLVDGRLCLAD